MDWLKDNPTLDVPNHIANNGKAWGDSNDPEDVEAQIKQAKNDKAELKDKRKKGTGAGSEQESEPAKKKSKKVKAKAKGKGKAKGKTADPTNLQGNSGAGDEGGTTTTFTSRKLQCRRQGPQMVHQALLHSAQFRQVFKVIAV